MLNSKLRRLKAVADKIADEDSTASAGDDGIRSYFHGFRENNDTRLPPTKKKGKVLKAPTQKLLSRAWIRAHPDQVEPSEEFECLRNLTHQSIPDEWLREKDVAMFGEETDTGDEGYDGGDED